MKKIINGRVITPYREVDGWEIVFDNGKITYAGERNPETDSECELIDASGKYVSPGFIDLHTHGGGGHDFMDATEEAFIGAAQAHAKHGTTALMPTSLAASDEEMDALFTCYENVRNNGTGGAQLLGLHLEGPYFAFNQKGAQDPRYLQNPSQEHYGPILKRGEGLIARWSAAAELPGALVAVEAVMRITTQLTMVTMSTEGAKDATALTEDEVAGMKKLFVQNAAALVASLYGEPVEETIKTIPEPTEVPPVIE